MLWRHAAAVAAMTKRTEGRAENAKILTGSDQDGQD